MLKLQTHSIRRQGLSVQADVCALPASTKPMRESVPGYHAFQLGTNQKEGG